MPSLIRFVLLAVMALLVVVLAFSMIGCLPLQGVGASIGNALGDAVGNTAGNAVHSPYWTLMEEPFPDSLTVPVAGVRRKQLRDSWGAPRDGGERSHEGIDIFAKRKTPVVSATHGIITRKGETERGGQVVWVLGPGGHRHYYAHLDSFGLHEEGVWVQAGDTLGYVGTTGNAKGASPHLHYGVYSDTGAVNPYPLLVPKQAATTAKRAQR